MNRNDHISVHDLYDVLDAADLVTLNGLVLDAAVESRDLPGAVCLVFPSFTLTIAPGADIRYVGHGGFQSSRWVGTLQIWERPAE